VATAGNGTVKLTWKAPASNGGATVSKYAVQSYIGGKWTNVAFPTGLGYTVTNLANGTQYSFRIRAYNAAGWSPISTTVNGVPHAVVPTAPPDMTMTIGNGSVTVMWLPPVHNGGATVDKYRIQQATTKAGPWTIIGEPTALNHVAKGLTNGTRYYFQVAAHNAAGWGPYSTVFSQVPLTAPSAPYKPQATAGDGSVDLSWGTPLSNGGGQIK
jgi:hypothetical protein